MVLFVIAREHRDRGDPVDNKVARIRVRALLTGLLRYARNDKKKATEWHKTSIYDFSLARHSANQ